MNTPKIVNTYQRLAPLYNFFEGQVLHAGRVTASNIINTLHAQTLLEVGVGTGLMLPLYSKSIQITGLDVSSAMLEQAEQLVNMRALSNVRLQLYDGNALPYPNDAFDCVVLPYVYSVVSSPIQFIHECHRVCKPGGTLLIINHFSYKNKRSIWTLPETLAAPFEALLGFKAKFSYEDHIAALPWPVAHESKANMLNLTSIIQIIK